MLARVNEAHPPTRDDFVERARTIALDSETLEALDDDAVTSLLEFRFRYLVSCGFGSTAALLLAVRTDVSLASLVERFSEPAGAVSTASGS